MSSLLWHMINGLFGHMTCMTLTVLFYWLYGHMSFVPGHTDLTHVGMHGHSIKRLVNDRWQWVTSNDLLGCHQRKRWRHSLSLEWSSWTQTRTTVRVIVWQWEWHQAHSTLYSKNYITNLSITAQTYNKNNCFKRKPLCLQCDYLIG